MTWYSDAITRRAALFALAVAALEHAGHIEAQPARQLRRIGILGLANTSQLAGATPQSASTEALLRGLRELGYVYGEHYVTEARGADGKPDRFASLASELVASGVDVLVATGPAIPALMQATSSIPIVMGGAADPVASGYIQSLAHPGGNVTGLSLQAVDATGKRLELMKELVPGTAPMAVIWNGSNALNLRAAEAAARERGWKLMPFEVKDSADVERAFKVAGNARVGAVQVLAAAILFPQARRIAELAAATKIPAMYELRPYVEAGGLISYGPDINEIWRRAATFVDKILKGAKPADLAVEQPTKFELVINLKAAKALGLAIPESLLLRADAVIE